MKRMQDFERSALREIDAYHSQKLRHPSLIYCQTIKPEHGLLYLAMDLCDCSLSASTSQGRTFLARVQRDAALQRRLARQLMEGLAFLHGPEVCVLHRDLKPSNVLVQAAVSVLVDLPGVVELSD